MKKLLLNSIVMALAVCPSSQIFAGTPNKANSAKSRVLIEEKYYGDSQGYVPDDIVGAYIRYYYNTKGFVIASTRTGREAGPQGYKDTFVPTKYERYAFDGQNVPTSKATWLWGLYDFEDDAWAMQKNSDVNYRYDENGRLVYEESSYNYIEYTYDKDGNLTNESTYIKSTKQLQQSLTYSEFDENGNPGHISSTGAYDSYIYETALTYDDNGNKTEALQYKEVDDPDNPGSKKNQKTQIEKWTYNESGVLTEYVLSTYDGDGNEVPSTRNTYELVDGNANEVSVCNYTYYNGEWTRWGKPVHYVYADFSGKEENTAAVLEASLDENAINTVDLTFSLPQLATLKKSQFVIYRNAQPVDTVATTDILDPKTNKCKYQDKGVTNGDYTYFVQAIYSTKTNPFLPDPETWEGFYSSNPVDVKVDTKLPAATDVKLTNGVVEEGGTLLDPTENYYATIGWTNPSDADLEKYGFIDNGVYELRMKVADKKFTDKADNEFTKQIYRELNCFVVTKYKYGKAISDTLKVTIDDIKNFGTNSIGQVTAKGIVNTTFNGRTISLSDNANITVFSINGEKVDACADTNSISLENLPSATYIICVEKNGKVNAYKYNVK